MHYTVSPLQVPSVRSLVSVLSTVQPITKAGWRYASEEGGALSVTTAGIQWMRQWSAGSLDSMMEVRYN